MASQIVNELHKAINILGLPPGTQVAIREDFSTSKVYIDVNGKNVTTLTHAFIATAPLSVLRASLAAVRAAAMPVQPKPPPRPAASRMFSRGAQYINPIGSIRSLFYDDLEEEIYRARNDPVYRWYLSPPQEEHDVTVRAARIWYDEGTDSYQMSTPYDKGFVEWFKVEIPKEHRAWNAEAKLWSVSPQVVEKVRKVVETTFGECHFTAKLHTGTADIEGVFEDFCRIMGEARLNQLYRLMSIEVHPDKQGGSHEKMAELNRVWKGVKAKLALPK